VTTQAEVSEHEIPQPTLQPIVLAVGTPYIVKSGDTLGGIAASFGVTVSALQQAKV